YGTSIVYPISSMGAHVSEVPNQQVGRRTPIETRAHVAYFGAFGYELDLNQLSDNEKEIVKKQVAYYKVHRALINQGNFYRLTSPFENNIVSWIIVSEDKTEALAGYYKILNMANKGWKYFKLAGLDENKQYIMDGDLSKLYYGNELMYAGVVIDEKSLAG